MQNPTSSTPSQENEIKARNGFPMLALNLLLLLGSIAFFIFSANSIGHGDSASRGLNAMLAVSSFVGLVASPIVFLLAIISCNGHFTLQPNEARLLILFGAYKGTVRRSGFFWCNPFYARFTKISLRAYNLNMDKLKVNDKGGNPIEIAAVVVWHVADTAQAKFDVVDYNRYVTIQSESALRHLASSYNYDHSEANEMTLRGGGDVVTAALTSELQARLGKAGVVVDEARISYLAYAPEIAQAMLRRQQAQAVIAARQLIVQGAVGMVEMALNELSARKVVHLDDERRAAMVSNLLVVLCGETEAQPVINTGTLYN